MTGTRNLISDVAGVRVGNAHDERLGSGVTVLLAARPLIAAVDVRGGGPGTRETDAVSLAGMVDEVHAIVLSGGSAFGLSAATGVQSWLAEHGVGFAIRSARVPLVPQAVLFDLLNGGNKAWGPSPPYERLGRMACETAGVDFALGSASQTLDRGLMVGALAAVNPVGSPTIGDTPHFWASPFEVDNEFGGHGFPNPLPPGALEPRLKGGPQEATTIAIVATNAKLSTREAHRLAVMAQTGLARAIYPVHTPLDGDVVFAAATGELAFDDPVLGLARLGTAAANVLARAVARGVYEATPAPGYWAGPPAYRTLFPPRR
jgi:D-aminopeptidase